MPISGSRIVLVGASAGGIEALITLFAGIPAEFPAAIAVVLHRSPSKGSHLIDVLQRSARLPIVEPERAVALEAGTIYLAPRDQHLQMRDGVVEPIRGPKENFSRPAVDPLFRTGAEAHGRRVIGVVLSGWGSDGVAGLIAIKRAHGVSIVQRPDEAGAPGMPLNALMRDHVDWVLPIAEIADVLVRLAHGEAVEPQVLGPA